MAYSWHKMDMYLEIIIKEPTSYVYATYHVNAHDGIPDQWDMILSEYILSSINPPDQTWLQPVQYVIIKRGVILWHNQD